MLAWIVVDIAPDLWGAQQPFNSLGFVEAFINSEADIGRKFEIHAASDLAAEIAFVAVESCEYRCGILPAEREDVHSGDSQVRRHAHLWNRDEMGFDHRIVDFAAC